MIRAVLSALSVSALAACASAGGKLPRTLGERASGFGYVPLDGLAVSQEIDHAQCRSPKDTSKNLDPLPLLESLPDLSVRFAVASFSADGGLTFGPAKVTIAGQAYRAVLDYVNVETVPVDFQLGVAVRDSNGKVHQQGILTPLGVGDTIVSYLARAVGSSVRTQFAFTIQTAKDTALKPGYDPITIPIYIGIGMRLSADIRAQKDNLTLSSLSAIAAEAQTDALSGTLTVQTLGLSGKSVATALPMPSKLDQTTVENGILALGTARSVLYTGTNQLGDVVTTPRIVGLYSPLGADPRLINAIYSELAKVRPTLGRVCSLTSIAP